MTRKTDPQPPKPTRSPEGDDNDSDGVDWSGDSCPIPDSHDKLAEAHHFLHRMLETFHQPDEFRWNLSAFLQASRSVTLLLQAELGGREGFDDWYAPIRARLAGDPLLNAMVEGRNTVVHKGRLRRRSKVELGLTKDGDFAWGWGAISMSMFLAAIFSADSVRAMSFMRLRGSDMGFVERGSSME